MSAVADNDTKGVADGIEGTMGRGLQVIFGFFMTSLGLNGVVNTVINVFRKIGDFLRKAVQKGVDMVVNWVKDKFKGLFKRRGAGAEVEEEDAHEESNPHEQITAAERRKHLKIAQSIKSELEKTDENVPQDFETFRKGKEVMALSLENRYNPQVRKKVGTKIVKVNIGFAPLVQDRKDKDVDFTVVIAPNTTTVRGTALYPGSNYDPSTRTSVEIWRDASPKTTLRNERLSNVPIRVQMAKDELVNRYGRGKKPIIDAILAVNHGQSPRKFKGLRAEEAITVTPKAHTIDRHMKGMGQLPSEKSQALRILLNYPPISAGKAGYFNTLGHADSITHQGLSKGFGSGGQKWHIARDLIINKLGQSRPHNEIILHASAPSGSFSVEANETLPLDTADLPKYLNGHTWRQYDRNYSWAGAARGERPLWPDDPNRHILADPTNPLTKYFVPTYTRIKILPNETAPGGWYVLTSWPEK